MSQTIRIRQPSGLRLYTLKFINEIMYSHGTEKVFNFLNDIYMILGLCTAITNHCLL